MNATARQAKLDQAAAMWRDMLDELGIDVRDPQARLALHVCSRSLREAATDHAHDHRNRTLLAGLSLDALLQETL